MLVCLGSQNALPSDDDDKDPNDPHKALDIDLDKYVPHFRHLQFRGRPICVFQGRYRYRLLQIK